MAIYRRSGDIVAQAGCVCVMKKFDESQCHFHTNALDIIQTIFICWDVQMKVIEQLIVSLKLHGSLSTCFFNKSMTSLWTLADVLQNSHFIESLKVSCTLHHMFMLCSWKVYNMFMEISEIPRTYHNFPIWILWDLVQQ